MGTWGTSISANDSFQDVYQDFFQLYNDGLEPKEITEELLISYNEEINSKEDSNNFWFAIAKAQWECKKLDPQIFKKIKEIIETDSDIIVWKEFGASDKDLKKRKIVLSKFLETLSFEKEKAKARKKKVIRQPHFEKGDCISIKLENNFFGGLVVLEEIRDTELGLNLIAATKIYKTSKPTISDFENAELLISTFTHASNKFNIGWLYKNSLRKSIEEIEIIGKIKVEIDYSEKDYNNGFYYNATLEKFKLDIEKQMKNNNFENIKSKGKNTIKEFTRKSKWKLW